MCPGGRFIPAVTDYPLRLPPGLPQVFLANIVSLLPGTLSATPDGQASKVHVLDGRGEFMTELRALEQRVARMCGALLATSHGGE
ncbi:MAG: Na+/H+ antiporter subunit E [Thiogranum sp.]|jgi:multicomponent Na+:H+ antiporter subunit E